MAASSSNDGNNANQAEDETTGVGSSSSSIIARHANTDTAGDGKEDVITIDPSSNNHNKNFNITSHHYFLQRLGLLADEMDWPANFSHSSSSSSSSINPNLVAVSSTENGSATVSVGGCGCGDDGGADSSTAPVRERPKPSSSTSFLCGGNGGWRARDALTSILGPKVCTVQSDSGLTYGELVLMEKSEQRRQHGEELLGLASSSSKSPSSPAAASAATVGAAGAAPVAVSSSSSSSSVAASSQMVSIDSILASLLTPKDTLEAHQGDSGDETTMKIQQLINSDHVRRAFDAAAYAILRGECRRTSSSTPAAATASTVDHSTSGEVKKEDIVASTKTMDGGSTAGMSDHYDPPLILAMESIRRSRIAILTDASSGNCRSVPPFLKKNHTIPWFHLPVVVPGGGAGGSGEVGVGAGGGEAGGAGGGLKKATTTKGLTSPSSSSTSVVAVAGGVPSSNNMMESSDKVPLGVVDKGGVVKKTKMERKPMKKRAHADNDDDDDDEASGSPKKRIKLKKPAITRVSTTNSPHPPPPPPPSGTISIIEEMKKPSGEAVCGGKKTKKEKMPAAVAATTTTAAVVTKMKQAKLTSATTKPTPTAKTTTANKKQTSPQLPTKLLSSSFSSSLSKHPSNSPTGHTTTRKYTRSPSSTAAEDAAAAAAAAESSSISFHPAITRAIVSGAAMKLFSEYDSPKVLLLDGNDDVGANAASFSDEEARMEQIMSTIIHGANLVGTASESPMQTSSSPSSPNKHKITDKNIAKLKNVNMKNIVARASTLGHRVWNESRIVTRQWDQRREFRMDSALSRVDGVGGGYYCGVRTPVLLDDGDLPLTGGRDGGDMKTTNPFLVRPAHTLPLIAPNSFVAMNSGELTNAPTDQIGSGSASLMNQGSKSTIIPSNRLKEDDEWTRSCLPRLLDILSKGAGHAIVHDVEWTHRAGRVANMLQAMSRSLSMSASRMSQSSRHHLTPTTTRRTLYPNFGPHLIVTSNGEDFDAFSAVFGPLGMGLHQSIFKTGSSKIDNNTFAHDSEDENDVVLRVLPYHGSKDQRRRLRKHFSSISPSPMSHFSFLGGLPDSPFHVVLTTYSELLEDYAHFCQIPFQVVILDDGMSWLGCASSDPHGDIGMLWNTGLWSKFDFGSGSAGVADNGSNLSTPWDFSKDVAGLESECGNSNTNVNINNTLKINAADELVGERVGSHGRFPIGLMARHRILLASGMHAQHQGKVHKAPVQGLVTFLAPQFADTIMDDWEQSCVSQCKHSMTSLRSVIARLVVVYLGDATVRAPGDLIALSQRALDGELPLRPSITSTTDREDELIQSQKISHSRQIASAWFPPHSSIRKEIQLMSPKPILAALKRSNATGFFCEEITTASSLTTAGATGSVVGLSAYRAAVRCGRCFTSESGLKQHIISSHAPHGTWLCRSCGGDCGTSQARSHHERACRMQRKLSLQKSEGSEITPSSAVGRGGNKQLKRKEAESKSEFVFDASGMNHVSGHAGVWLLANGKFVVKVDGTLLVDNESESKAPLLFDTADGASKKFDQVVAKSGTLRKLKVNYPPPTQLEDDTKSGNILAGNKKKTKADGKDDIVTPDLSVIDIKKLPPHVKPLLRDPNFTSRTGGNSKRYVYAYRGVCRQERKGLSRWQSQISFNGQNHYLGTFDSEWDAAAVYAWAHLILYGEEATKKAQREGEEAAAAFKQTQKDIAEGKIPTPSPKPAVKKKRGAPKKIKVDTTSSAKPSVESSIDEVKSEEAIVNVVKPEITETTSYIQPKSKIISATTTITATSVHGKKKRPVSSKEWSKLKTECAMMLSSGTKGTSKASVLATRKDIADMSEQSLMQNVSDYTASDSVSSIAKNFLGTIHSPGINAQPLPTSTPNSVAVPMRPCLIGLRASDFGWDVNKFMDSCRDTSVESASISSKISFEFGVANTSFFAFVFSSSFTLGRASKEMNDALVSNNGPRIGNTLGMPVGNLDCNVGGLEFFCSELAAKIQCVPSKHSNFQFVACNNDDIITLNGQRLYASMGPLPLRDRDICSVGARVFVFVEKAAHQNPL